MKKQNGVNAFGVIGLGRFGTAMVKTLAEAGKEVIALDKDEQKVRAVRKYTDFAFVVENLTQETLEETGIQNCGTVTVCIGEQMDTSILTTLNLVSLGVPAVIAKATSLEHGEILEKLGAEVVYPERDMAIRLAHRLETSRMLDFIQLSEQLNISKLIIPDRIVGKTVLSVNLRKEFGINIIAIENSGILIETIHPDYVFKKGDILFISGSKAGLNRLSAWAEKA